MLAEIRGGLSVTAQFFAQNRRNPRGKPSGMESRMSKTPTIRVDARAPMTPEILLFFNFCVDWAEKLENLIGSVSMEIITATWAQANYHWQGKPLITLMSNSSDSSIVDYIDNRHSGGRDREMVNKVLLWESVLKPILVREVEKVINAWVAKLTAINDPSIIAAINYSKFA